MNLLYKNLDKKNILLLSLILLFTLFVTRPIDNFDIWWHLNSGLWMLENWRILDHDLWSFTKFNEYWVNISWVFQVAIAFTYKAGGLWGLYLFKAICIFIAFSIIAASIKNKNSILSFSFSFLILLPFIYGHLHLRPNLFEIIALLSLVFISQRPCNLRIVCIGFLILLFFANSHASVIVGSTAFALHIMFGEWERVVTVRNKILFSLIIICTPLFTPYGLEILNLLLVHDGSDSIRYYVGEWVQRDTYPLAVWLVFLLTVIFFINKKIDINITEKFLLIFFLLYSFKYQRFELELAILLLRPLTIIIDYVLVEIKHKNKQLLIILSVVFLLSHSLIYSTQLLNLAPSLYSNLPSDKYKYPLITLKQLKKISGELNRDLKVINDYDYGGYISLHTESKVKVFVDGRMSTLYPESLLIPPYESDQSILRNLARKYDADAILLKLDKANLIYADNPDWQLISYDPASVLFVKKSIINELDYPSIKYNPYQYISAYNSSELKFHKEQTLKLLALTEDNPIAMNHMAVFLSGEIDSNETRQQVLGYLEKSIALNPGDIFTRATYAYLVVTTFSNLSAVADDFFRFLPPADKLTSGINLSYDLTFARTLIDLGMSNKALEYLYPDIKSRRYAIDKLTDTWKLRVIAHSELGESKKAKNCLAIIYELVNSEDKREMESLDNLAKSIDKKSDSL